MKNYKECYVCGKQIKDTKRQVYIGQGLYRHTSCEAGSIKWLKSNNPKIKKFKKYFKGGLL